MELNVSQPRKQAGFTLVEIAIVLVIVGLLLGAVLKGQELIFNSKVKATFNMSKEFSAAINGYQDRYKAIPGDDGTAAVRFPAFAPLPTNGNNDGWINWQAFPCNAATVGENCQVFLHLRAAGFVSGTGAEGAKTPFGGNTAISASAQLFPNTGSNPVFALQNTGITHKIGVAIDTAFDDADPTRGTFRCRNLAAYNMAAIDTTVPDWCSIQM
jgi:prepilin-type N-terminal cleavage/methylation domain-containing protein